MPLEKGKSAATFSRNVAEMMHSGRSQNVALAAAYNARRHSASGGLIPHRDMGGGLAPSGMGPVAPTSTSQGPQVQNAMAQFSKMSPEQLQEFVVRAAGSPVGKIAERVLQQKQISPQLQQTASSMAQPTPMSGPGPAPTGIIPSLQSQHRGGVTKRAAGGGVGDKPIYGLLHSPMGAAGGRSDTLPHEVEPDTYVIPADVVSGMGEGDTHSGAKALEAMFTKLTGIPPEQAYASVQGRGKKVPVLVANGEFLVPPLWVQGIGHGKHKQGHAALDALVKKRRSQTIKEMRKLPGPAK